MIQEIETAEEYSKFIKTNKFAVIHFWASWNLYDLTMCQRLEEFDSTFAETVLFLGLNVDQQNLFEVSRNAKICNIPALAFYHNGNRVETLIGLASRGQIQGKIDAILNFS